MFESKTAEHSQKYSSLLALPDEVLILILSNLSPESLIAFLLTSRRNHGLASDQKLWENLFLRHFPHRHLVLCTVRKYLPREIDWITEFKKAFFATSERLFSLIQSNNLGKYPYPITYKDLISIVDNDKNILFSDEHEEHLDCLKSLCVLHVNMNDESIIPYYRLKLAIALRYDKELIRRLKVRESLDRALHWERRFQNNVTTNSSRILEEACLRAIEVGDESEVKTLLQEGLSINENVVNTFEEYYQAKDDRIYIPHDCKLIHYAAIGKSLTILELLLNAGADVNAKDSLGNTPLHYLLLESQEISLFVLVALLYAGANINEPNNKGYTPFHNALKCQNEIIIQILMDFGAEVNQEIPEGKSYLHLIAENSANFTKLYALLIFRFPSIIHSESTDSNCNTPLHIAASVGNVEAIEKWCTTETVNLQNLELRTPCHLAFLSGKVTKKTLNIMMRANSDLTLTDKDGNTLLHVTENVDSSIVIKRLISEYIARSLPLNSVNHAEETPLSLALKSNFNFVRHLLENNGDNNNGNTILHKLVMENENEYLKKNNFLKMLNIGIDPMQKNLQGQTALHLAIIYRMGFSLRLLIEKCELLKSDIEELLELTRIKLKNTKEKKSFIRVLACREYFCCAIEILQRSLYSSTFFSGTNNESDYIAFLQASREQNHNVYNSVMLTHLCDESLSDHVKLKLISFILSLDDCDDLICKHDVDERDIEESDSKEDSKYNELILAQNVIILLGAQCILKKPHPYVLTVLTSWGTGEEITILAGLWLTP